MDEHFEECENIVLDYIWRNRRFPVIGDARADDEEWLEQIGNYIDYDKYNIDDYKKWVLDGNGVDELLYDEYNWSGCIHSHEQLQYILQKMNIKKGI